MKNEENFAPKSIAILGRQPALGIAELESLYGAEAITPFGTHACFLSLGADEVDFDRLGGSVRIAKVLTELPSTSWTDIEKHLLQTAPEHAGHIDGKLSFGISVFGMQINPRKIVKTALLIKKTIKASGHSVRMVPHDKTELGAATVLYNKLTAKNGWELLVISDGKTAFLAQTVKIQDIDAYAARDQARPKRDAKVGMLPPKLAQIIVNLAVGRIESGERSMEYEDKNGSNSVPRTSYLVLDPFCGTGVTLQEAMLMDYDVYGSDLEPRMVEYTEANLDWLAGKRNMEKGIWKLQVADATTHKWEFSKIYNLKSKIFVASETFLGQPLTSLPNGEHLSKIIYEANLVNHKFLLNIIKQIPSGTRLCLAVPTWRGNHEFLHLPMLDHLTEMGYTRQRFKYVSNEDLIYHRENQVVGRELLVLVKS